MCHTARFVPKEHVHELAGLVKRRLPKLDEFQVVVCPVHARRCPHVVKPVVKGFRPIFATDKRDYPFRDELSYALAAFLVTQLTGAVEGESLQLALIKWRTPLT